MSFQKNVQSAAEVFAGLAQHDKALQAIADVVVSALRNGHKVLACGNGGSTAEAQHFTTELVGRFRHDRLSLPAIYLGGDASQVTCIANDFHFDEIFSRPLSAFGQKGDVLLCFSTSGKSPNILKALEVARERGIVSVSFLGKGGGDARGKSNLEIVVASDMTARVQEAHLFLLHELCEYIEAAFPVPSK